MLLVFCLVALSACGDCWTGFKREPDKYKFATEFRYAGDKEITKEDVQEFIRIMATFNVKAEMKLDGEKVEPAPTPVPVADKPAAAATATPSVPKPASPTPNVPLEMLAGWKTQVAGLVQAASQDDLEKALDEFAKLTDDAR